MKQEIKSAITHLIADRALLLLATIVSVGAVIYIVYTAINLNPTDLQLAIRYTSFGETHFYREKWWYLLSFVGFGLLFLLAHLGILIKLNAIGLRQLALAFGWLSIVILMIAFVYTLQVLNIAYLN